MKAFIYDKKLITNSKAVTFTRFFDNKNVQFFTNISDINIDYIKDKKMPRYDYNDEFSPRSVIRYIDGLLTGKCDSYSFFNNWLDLNKYMNEDDGV